MKSGAVGSGTRITFSCFGYIFEELSCSVDRDSKEVGFVGLVGEAVERFFERSTRILASTTLLPM